jgi:hypothetical protein
LLNVDVTVVALGVAVGDAFAGTLAGAVADGNGVGGVR